MKKSLQNLAFLNEVHLRINIREDLQTNLYSLFSFCQQFLPFDYCGILTENGIDKNYSPLFLFPHHEFNSTAVNSEFAKGHFATKKSIYSNSLKDEGRFKYHFMTNRKDENSLLVAPLHSATNEFEGVIIALSKNKNFFAEVDLSLFEYLSKLIVLLLQIYQAQNTTISAIRQYDKELYAELRNTKKVMDKLIECSVKITGADYGCLVRYNDLKRQLECRYADGCAKMGKVKKEKCIFKLDNPNSIVSVVFREKKAKKVDNLEIDRFKSSCNENGEPILSQAAIPLQGFSKNPFGVLILESKQAAHFTNWDVELLNALPDFGVTAFRNSKIFRKLEMLSEASDVLLKEYEKKGLAEKFEYIVCKTIELLDAELCSLFLVDGKFVKLKTSYKIDNMGLIKKVDRINITLPIVSGYKTGLTSDLAYSKRVFNEYGEKLVAYPAIKESRKSDFLPSQYCFSLIAYPLLDEDGKLIGLLKAYNKLGGNSMPLSDAGFSKEFDEPLMKILTTKLIISIKNAQLVNELEKYKLIIETTSDPVVTTTLDGTITFMNAGALQLFGDIRGEKVREIYWSDEFSTGYAKAHEVMRRLFESSSHSLSNFETSFIGIDNTEVPVNASFNLIKDSDNKVVGTIGIVKDLRKTKELIEVGSALLSLHSVDEILDKISSICLNITNATRAYCKLFDESSNRLFLKSLKSTIPADSFPVDSSDIDQGITGHVFMTQKPFIAYEKSNKFCGLFGDVESKIAVPINRFDSNANKVKNFGVINVDSFRKNAFSLNDMFNLTTIANQAAAAIENASLLASQTKIINELTALENIQEAITRNLDIDKILESLLNVVVDVLGFDYATISKVERSRGKIGAVKGRNVPQDFINVAWHSLDSNDIQAWVVREKKEAILSEWDERLDKALYDLYHHEKLVRIYLPILFRDEAFGTLETGYKKENRQDISDEEILILRKVVNLASIGIDQAYLRIEQKLFGDQLSALNQANIDIQSSRTENEVVRFTFKGLESIGYSKAMLSLLNETTGKIEGRYALGENWKRILNETKRELTGKDILANAMREKRSILSSDCYADPSCDREAIRKADIKSQYVIPLIFDNKPIGTLQIDLSDRPGLLSKGREQILKRRMEVLETFASQIAIAIRNVRDRKMIDLLETTLTETAHEFRSPLHNILTQIGGLISYLPEGFDKEDNIKKIYEIISEEANRARRQMDNTLLLSDRSRGSMGFCFVEGKIQDVIEKCVANYKIRALERGISFIIKDNIKKLSAFKFDNQKIEQVISNLLDNAVKYSHFNRLIQIQGFDDNTNINIDIWDKGLGIPESEFDNIFQGFTRSRYKDKKSYIPGTGLGLKICREIVDKHGGTINVKSTPFFQDPRKIREFDGYDTVFTVILPKKPKEK